MRAPAIHPYIREKIFEPRSLAELYKGTPALQQPENSMNLFVLSLPVNNLYSAKTILL